MTSSDGLSDSSKVVVKPDGSILVAGPVGATARTFGVIHLKANGAPDPSFGAGGETDVVLPAGLTPVAPLLEFYHVPSPSDLLLQPDGKFVVVGIAQTADAIPKVVTIVARFDADGLPDQGAYAYRVLGQADVIIPFGTPGTGQSLPALADYTGSGHVELGVYLPSLGVLAYRPAFGSDLYEAFGLPGPGQTIPVTRVILSPFPGSGGGSAHAMAIPVPDVVTDGLAPLDFITRPDKKAKGGRSA